MPSCAERAAAIAERYPLYAGLGAHVDGARAPAPGFRRGARLGVRSDGALRVILPGCHPTPDPCGYWDAVFAFLAATAVAALLTPLAARLARRVGAIAMPRERGLATRSTPLLGGLAIFAGVMVAAAIWMPDDDPAAAHGRHGPARRDRPHLGVIAGAAVITLVGAIDDACDLRRC